MVHEQPPRHEIVNYMFDQKIDCIAVKYNSKRYPSNGILKASFIACVSQIHPGIVIRMGFPDLHKPCVKNYFFGVVTIVSMHSDDDGQDFPSVIRVHWGDDTFNDFCCFNSQDFSFDALVGCVNDFAAFRNGSLAGVDALRWGLIRKFEGYVQAARPCSATFRFSSPTRSHPEVVMWHFAKNSTKHKMAKIISKQSGQNRKKYDAGPKVGAACRATTEIEKRDETNSRQSPKAARSPLHAKDGTISFLLQVASYVSSMKNCPIRLSQK